MSLKKPNTLSILRKRKFSSGIRSLTPSVDIFGSSEAAQLQFFSMFFKFSLQQRGVFIEMKRMSVIQLIAEFQQPALKYENETSYMISCFIVLFEKQSSTQPAT